MARLSPNQVCVLSRAAGGTVGWLPGAEVRPTTAASLVRRQLLEPAVKTGVFGLAITAAGRARIEAAAEPLSAELRASKRFEVNSAETIASYRAAKLEQIVALLKRQGARV